MQLATSMRDAPGTLREFETIYILRSDVGEDRITQLNQRLRSLLEESGGKLIRVDNWGKRRLAYEIQKQLKGIYLVWRYLAPSRLIAELSRQLRLHDAVMRHMTVHVADDVRAELRACETDDEGFQAAGRVGPDEEELATGSAPREDAETDAAQTEDEGTVVAEGSAPEAVQATPVEEK